MPAEVVVFSSTSPTTSEQIEMNPFHKELLKSTDQKNSGSICLIEDKWLAGLKDNKIDFEYRGEKHRKKSLTYYFRKSGTKILVLNGGSYSKYSQLRSSINVFLKNAAHNQLQSFYFIVVSENFFRLAKMEASKTYSNKEAKKGRYQNPLLNMINNFETKVDLNEQYIGNSEPCIVVRNMIGIASQSDYHVLILGETGTGKEVVARAIHQCSDRSTKPFIAVNCSAIPSELFESEIFGYIKGSHSLAHKNKKGLWEMANGGTLFLDEIGDLALNHQTKILRALDDKKILPVGGLSPIEVNVRIIAATNKKIEVLVTEKSGEFRDDLFYRISTFIIRTPPLRDHQEDIPKLAQKLWEKIGIKNLSSAVLTELRYMNWPGNVRQLKYFLERINALFGKDQITVKHVHVLKLQDMENLFKSSSDSHGHKKTSRAKDYEKAVMKIEFLLKASLYCEDEKKRKELLENVKESLEEMY